MASSLNPERLLRSPSLRKLRQMLQNYLEQRSALVLVLEHINTSNREDLQDAVLTALKELQEKQVLLLEEALQEEMSSDSGEVP